MLEKAVGASVTNVATPSSFKHFLPNIAVLQTEAIIGQVLGKSTEMCCSEI